MSKKAKLKPFHVLVPESMQRDLRLVASFRGESMATLVRRAVAKEIKESLREREER